MALYANNLNVYIKDQLTQTQKLISNKLKQSKGFRTSIVAVDDFGRVIFEEENQTVLGGALFTMLKCFNIDLQWDVETLNNIKSIATTGTPVADKDDTFVCLFGVGIGGSGEVPGTVKPVKFQQRELNNMIPFRITDQPLSPTELQKYHFREALGQDFIAYYLKLFDNMSPKVLWKDGIDGEDGSPVPPNVYQNNTNTPMECCIELTLRVDKKDFQEYFALTGNASDAIINELGLFTGVKKEISPGVFDYKDVRLFSALNFKNTNLANVGGINYFYRIYFV